MAFPFSVPLAVSVLLVILTAVSGLDLASRCLSSFNPGECPCSRRQTPSLDFCLSAADRPDVCRQRACPSHYVCDCSGDTLCRATPIRSALTCFSPVAADGTCSCQRSVIRLAPGAQTPSMLVPLRPHRPLHSLRALIPRNNIFCSERPSFWASSHGLDLLQRHWTLAARQYRDSPLGANTYLVRFGHPGHAVSFTTPDALAASLPTHLLHNTPTDGDIIDPERTSPLSHMTAECMAASISIALASQGIPTREHATATPRFDMSTRMVLQPCSYLPRSNPAVGMDLGTFMDRAMLATGHYPLDDAALSHQHVTQACMAINRNFETCQVDVGCIAVSESPL